MNIRHTKREDIPALKTVLTGTQVFPSEMLSELISGFISANESNDLWLTCELADVPVGFCYAVPEELTDGTWNLLAVAVLPSKQGSGVGAALVEQLEITLKERGVRILIVDTSGTKEFRRTREFYRKQGYTEEARIRDFWAAGDDKVVFWKTL